MTLAIITEIEGLLSKLKSTFSPAVAAEVKAVENAGHELVSTSWEVLKTKGLQEAYAIVSAVVLSALAGTPWGVTLAGATVAVVAAGHDIAHAEIAMLASQAQADLIA